MNLDKLADLKRLIADATDFMQPFKFFMDHFGDSVEFIDYGERVSHSKLEKMLGICASSIVSGPSARVDNFLIIKVHEHPFLHGFCRINGRPANFIYFDDVQLGIMAIVPTSPDGETLLQRFTVRDLPSGTVPSDN